MEGKLKKEELLKIIGQMEVIEKLPKQLLQEFCRVFKVEEVNAPQNLLIQQFKNKMVDIFIQEADGYMDYLQLPKFKSLGADTTEKMYILFSSVWSEYTAYRLRQQATLTKKQIEEITPTFDSTEKMEQFHLRLLQIYRDSTICPKNARSNNKPLPQVKIAPQQHEAINFLYPNPPMNVGGTNGSIPNPMFSHYPFPQAPSYPKVEAQQGNPYIMENKQPIPPPQPMFDFSRYGMQSHHPPYYPSPELFQHQIPHLRSNEKKQQISKNYFCEQLETANTLFSRYQFIQCVCQGKKGVEDKNYFKCALCNYSYHLQCMKIDSSPAGGSVCPLCILRKQTIFCKVTHQPMKFNWHFNQRNKELRVEMTQEESHEIYQARKNGLDCQIRFLKINGKSLKKDKKAQFTNCNGYLQKAPKHTEITLPELSEDRHQPISLQIVLRSEDDSNEHSQPKLYLFAVFLITIKKVDEIVADLFASKHFVTLSYYSEFMNSEGRVEVSLQSESFARGQIKYPVRGQNCKHPDVFDLKNFLEVVSELKKDNDTEINCPICSNICTFFNYDKEIYNAIQNFPDYEQKKPQGISIERNGQFYWIGEDAHEEKGNQSQQMLPEDEAMDEERLDQEME